MIGVLVMPINPKQVVFAASAISLAIPIVMIFMSLCSLIWPRAMWWLSEGWKFRNAEPSGCTLVATRIGGLIGLIVGIALLFILNAVTGRA
jgi:hypothetical protein